MGPGGLSLGPEVWHAVRRSGVPTKLTPREMKVLQRMVHDTGGGVNAIAADLGITPRGVKFHRLHLYDKLQCPARRPEGLITRFWQIVEQTRREGAKGGAGREG